MVGIATTFRLAGGAARAGRLKRFVQGLLWGRPHGKSSSNKTSQLLGALPPVFGLFALEFVVHVREIEES